nr:hypothetical protein [Tanacetum cinerariifolium]
MNASVFPVGCYIESRLKKLEEDNRSLTKELKSFNTKVEAPAIKETVMDKEESSKQGRKISDIDVDAKVNLENVYNLDMAHEETVLSMQDVTDADVNEVAKEMVEVITTAKIIIDEVITASGELNAANEEPVSAAPTNITTAQPSEATKTTVDITTASKAKGIVFHAKEESATRTASSKSQVKDNGKAKLKKLEEENRSLTKELKSFNTKVESPAVKETVMDKEESSKQGRKISDIDVDGKVNLENVYNLDMAHEETVLSIQDVTDADVNEVAKEMVEVITTAKIIVDEVITASGELNAALLLDQSRRGCL